jgi:hypothetical protein
MVSQAPIGVDRRGRVTGPGGTSRKGDGVVGRKGKKRSVIKLIGWALAAAAVGQELRKPSTERTWHGRVGGFVPYDFRIPTVDRVRRSWWNPDDERIFTEPVFGVGWAVNLGRVVGLLGDQAEDRRRA